MDIHDNKTLRAENADLRTRLDEAEETLRAIRSGEVDALVIDDQVYTLESSDAASNRFRGEVLAQINEAVVAIDNEHRVTYLNPAAECLYEASASSVLGRHLHFLYEYRWSNEADEVAAGDEIEKLGFWRGENIHVKPNGDEVYVESTVNVLRDREGKRVGLLAVIRDVSERKDAEMALSRKEQELRDFVENATVGMHWVGPDGVIIWANRAELQMLGYANDEYVGRPISDFYADNVVVEDVLRRLRNGETLENYPVTLVCRDGSFRHAVVSSDVLWENGEFIHTRCFTRDVTERTLAEEALKSSERKLSIIYDNSPDALFLTAVEPGHRYRFVSVNETFLKVTGYEKERVEGVTIDGVIPQEDYLAALPKYEQVVKTCLSVVYEQVTRVPVGPRHVEITLTPIFTKGAVTHILGAAKDITARKEAEEALRASEERLTKALSIETVGVLYLEMNGLFISSNEAFANMSGYSVAEMSSRSIYWQDLTPPEFMQQSLGSFEELRKRGRTTPYEKEYLRKDGTRFWGLVAASLLNEHEAVEYVLDITSRKVAEEALREAHFRLESRVAERTEQLARTNEALQIEMEEHRIAEQQKGELLQKIVTTQEDERRRIARDIHDQLGQRVTALRLQLASLSSALDVHPDLSSRIKPLQKVAERLDSEVSFLAWELRPAALDDLGLPEATDAFLDEWSHHYSIPADLHLTGFNDGRLDAEVETHLYRIMQESLNNIAKHALATHVNVLLKRTNQGVTLIVEDNGKGFDTSGRNANGSSAKGLGLLGMNERAMLVKGNVQIESSPGAGTTIYVRVPNEIDGSVVRIGVD